MEVKKGLNNGQRKILDSVYTEQFEKIERALRDERSEGLAKVQAEVVKQAKKDKEVKKMIDAAATFFSLQNKLQTKLDEQGVYVEGQLSREPHLRYGRRGYGSVFSTPQLVEDYEKETRRLELAMAEKKKEMRAKIWGASVSYEEADAEIRELLKDI